MKTINLRLTLNVDFYPQGISAQYLKQNLTQMVSNAMYHGTLTGESHATVKKYNYKITERRSVKKHK